MLSQRDTRAMGRSNSESTLAKSCNSGRRRGTRLSASLQRVVNAWNVTTQVSTLLPAYDNSVDKGIAHINYVQWEY